jgi:hypothetical protein
MFIQPRLPLELFAKNRLSYLESLNTYYEELLMKLNSFLSEEYDSITPHQLLKYPSEIRHRINTCLRNYSTIRIIDNAICQEKLGTTLLELLTRSKQFGTTNRKGEKQKKQEHKIYILSREEIIIPKSIDSLQIEYKRLKTDINRDFMARDFICFDNHGCLVFTNIPNAVPYYNITPRFTEQVLSIFKSNWK